MANDKPFVVIRLVPKSPVDGTTFSTYVDNLALQAFDANTGQPVSGLAYAAPLTILQWPPGSGTYLAIAAEPTSAPTPYASANNYGNVLQFKSTDGICVGSYVFSADQTTIPASGLSVAEVRPDTVKLSGTLPDYVPAGTAVSFVGQPGGGTLATAAGPSFALTVNSAVTEADGQYVVLHFADTTGVTIGMGVAGTSIAAGTIVTAVTPSTVTISAAITGTPGSAGEVTFTLEPPIATFTRTPQSATSGAQNSTLKFQSGQTAGIPVGAILSPVSGVIAPGTRVTTATDKILVLSPPLLGSWPAGQEATFSFMLSSGIVQHTERIPIGWDFFDGEKYAVIPAAAATAILSLTPAELPAYLDLKITARRGSEIIPDASIYYNVKVITAEPPQSDDLYQAIPAADTALYLTLPPPPNTSAINLEIPADGSAPRFDTLITAMEAALKADPIQDLAIDTLVNSSAACRRIAYDIVWSVQNDLPPLPDPLESLYTNPPNPGGGGSTSTTDHGSNNFEMDRQKFEGALSSFYSTRNASAERLTKFIAAASAAMACERFSRTAATALLEFPVDPSAGFAGAVESEILLNGLGAGSPSGLDFGVPAAFFYVLGASLDKTTTAAQRFQMAAGDTAERLLQQFAAAGDAGLIDDPQLFAEQGLDSLAGITRFQAARRLVALGVPTASSSPSAVVLAGSPLASLVSTWLSATDPAGTQSPPPGPPPTYPGDDFTIWSQQVALLDQAGYLDLDLNALTQGFVIPPFAASPAAGADAGATALTFAPGTGIGAGMPVAGPGIAAGTTVQAVDGGQPVTVTLSAAVTAPVTTTTTLLFNATIPAVTAATTAASAAPSTALTFGATTGICAGMAVFGAGIAPGTAVVSVTASGVNLSTSITADVPDGAPVMFVIAPSAGQPLPALTATTTTDCGSGATLTFGGPGGTGAISAGMSAFGAGLAAGSTVLSATATTATLSADVTGDVPAGSVISFAILPSTLADQIAAWLPGTTTPPTPEPTIATLKQVTAAQWTAFFAQPGSPQWLPPFTQPVAPGASSGGTALQAGYVATRVRAFVRAVQQFFTVSTVATTAELPGTGAPPAFDLPRYDPIALTVAELGGFQFGTALSSTDLATAAALVFPGDPAAQDWLCQAMTTINELREVAGAALVPAPSAGTLPDAVSFTFSVMEALYARGFRSAADITALSPSDFQQALTGTVAYESAGALGAQAQKLASATPAAEESGGGFQPVNTDGSLVDCVPPPCLSPTGPIAYLQEMLALSRPSNCDDPAGTPAPTLGEVLSTRRGPVGHLSASRANLEIPVPLIDLVNECLEHLGATAPPAGGAVYDTAAAAREDGDSRLAAVPGHSTPATPEPAVFDALKTDFSSCLLPYSQALDVSRTYLGQLGSSRFEQMRTFRRCITEFVLDPAHEPAGFQSWLWRYPVRIDIAIEYLGITPQEYATMFRGDPVPEGPIGLAEFLARTCLSYCEFYELRESSFVPLEGDFPRCEPCCLDDLRLRFPGEHQQHDVALLQIFVRLWRKLRQVCDGGYSFAELRDICDVLQLEADGTLNPDFVRQLAAFQMLRDQFGLGLVNPADPPAPHAVDADRTHLLALWAGPAAAQWPWAVRHLVAAVERYARRGHGCEQRPTEFVKVLTDNLGPLSRLAGFDPDSATDSWHARPTHTLRFAEVLAKVYASRFSVGELIFLFTADPHLDGDDPFPLQGKNEALDTPLGLPDDEPHALWRLRRDLLATVDEDTEDDGEWPWRRIADALHAEFGFASDDIADLSRHFFTPAEHFTSHLAADKTSAPMWNEPPDGPLHYDAHAEVLSVRIPLTDRAIIAKLAEVRELRDVERHAVQDLYFQPRALLAGFALLFTDFATAQRVLIEEPDERRRLDYFRGQFLLCRRRARLIARHLTRHVASVTGHRVPEEDEAAELILRILSADENTPTGAGPCPGWECDSGAHPELTWTRPRGSALAALLGLAGTGLRAEYTAPDGNLAWRDVSAALHGFGAERDRENCPVPTVLPSLGATLGPRQQPFASVHNGLLMNDATGEWLGGAQGFTATWAGALLIENDGTYEFWAGGGPHDHDHDHDADRRQWRVTLRRGQRTSAEFPAALPLRRGAYELTVTLVQPEPEFRNEGELEPLHTGLRLEYRGPDTDGQRIDIPHHALFTVCGSQPLRAGIADLSTGAAAYLDGLYISSLRDIRRTYQRAFKALLFCRRLGLSARPGPQGKSELSYLLSQPHPFAGTGYYRAAGAIAVHAADFDFDFLPLRDSYHTPAPDADARTDPSPQRVQAMFDWWERLSDYTVASADVHHRSGRILWHLFEEAEQTQPAHPAYLLRHLAADTRHWHQDLRYFDCQNQPVYQVTSADLSDERWTLRAWHADRWLRSVQERFTIHDVEAARPDLWACDDPGATLPGEAKTANAELMGLVTSGFLENGPSPRYDDLRRLNDGLRDRGRRALLAYLCRKDRVALPWQPGRFATTPADLSDLLLLDVEAGLRERASRIDEAITAAQSFIRRSRLGLEPDWPVTREFARLWESRFETYRTWERARRRELYRENWIEWDEVARARRIEAFQFLESQLRSATLTLAAPGGLDWWSEGEQAGERTPRPLQQRVPAGIRALPATREGFTTLGSPEFAARPSWLATPPQPAGSVRSMAAAAVTGSAAPQSPPLWMEAAIKLGTRFVRVAAAGQDHSSGVDEYYFWLVDSQVYSYNGDTDSSGAGSYQFGFQDSYYDEFQQQSGEWNDESRVPSLLARWRPGQAVRLAWCRVHNGQFGQPRRAEEVIAVDSPPDLLFLGRAWDSLYFQITGAAAPTGDGDHSPPGFRYDLRSDHAVTLPQVLAPATPDVTYPGGLPCYPFFAFDEPGARLFPGSWFPVSMTVASALRSRCGHELALGWYRHAFDPSQQDCTWMHCPERSSDEPARERLGACCDSTKVSEQGARNRAVTLQYCHTLVEWADALMMHRERSPEAISQARLLYDAAARITGQRPRTVMLPEPPTAPAVTEFVPAYAPLNPQLMHLYDVIADRRELIRRSNDAQRGGWEEEDNGWWCARPCPYRFVSQIQKAIDLAGRVRELGSALLSAYEKGDAEYLASLHAEQERELRSLTIAIRQDQWRDADWQVQALQQTKDTNQANLLYYTSLYQSGLINSEIQNLDLTMNALQTRTGANMVEAEGEILNIVPDPFVGALSSGAAVPAGSKLAHMFEAIGRIMQAVADIQSTTASMNATQASWQRRAVEWLHQMQTLPIEIHHIELQILGAHRRRDQALRELNNQQRMAEHAAEVQEFLRDKFTAAELFLWLQRETAGLYRQMYDLARRAAREATRSFRLELPLADRWLGDVDTGTGTWDSLHAGLLAGERLDLALRRLERAYLEENRRELELTKNFSLRLDFPAAYLRLRTTGYCEISIPEWRFDVEYPGHFLRRFKALRVTVPVVAGPLTGVHCRVSLLSSMTRVSPELRPPAHHCCPDRGGHSEYEACADDPRVVREYGAHESIATSTAQDDPGLFELNFRDERYLPFEYRGVVCRLRIELPPENNYFDLDTVTDLVLRVSYTARDGGPLLREAAARDARDRLPGDGLRYFDLRHDFPDAWPGLLDDAGKLDDDRARPRELRLSFTPAMFPFVPGHPVSSIDRLLLLFAAPGAQSGRHHVIRLREAGQDDDDATQTECVASEQWPGLFAGTVDLREHPLGPLREERPVTCVVEVPAELGRVRDAFVIASYNGHRD